MQPIKWHGGKHYLAKRIIALMPEHTHYTEAFAGGLSVLLQKDCVGISEAVNDSYSELSNFWAVLRDEDKFAEFKRIVEATPFSEAVFNNPPDNRAVAFFVRARQSRQGLMKDFATPTTRVRRGMNENVSAWLTAVEGLSDVHARLKRVEIRSMDAIAFLRKYDHANALHYCDPPYLASTRTATNAYKHEMTFADHERLVECLKVLRGKFLLSGYPNELYDSCGWNYVDFEIDNKASSKSTKDLKIERVWANFPLDNTENLLASF